MRRSPALTLLSSAFALLLTGCGATLPHTASSLTPAATFSGRVHGGEQPVSGALVQLYTVGTTADGSASAALLTTPVASDANGNFNITGLYSCTAATQVYLVATGGNPGLTAPNPNLALMTALGSCSALTPQTFISVNELTTVAAVYALQSFMADSAHIGSSTADAPALNAAFLLANQLVSSSAGTITSAGSAAQLNTLADIIATCVNTLGGVANDGSTCGNLFALTPSSSGTPAADTITALLSIAQNPTDNVAQLYNLIPAAAPYQPSQTTPPPDLSLPQTPSANRASGLQAGPQVITFPPTGIGVSAPSQTVVISNNTTAAIPLNGISFAGADQADFAQTNTCGSSLTAFTTCTVAITFTPRGSSARNASLSVASATPDSPQLVALAGSGTSTAFNGPHAVVSHSVVNIYPRASYDVALSNTGNAPLAISSIALAGTPFNTQTNNCPSSLGSGASCTISVHSIAAGADQLTILTNDQSFTPNILVYQSPNSPSAVFTPSDVFFADAAIGSTSVYGYTYNQNAALTPAISGPQASQFSAATPVCTQGTYPETSPNCTFAVRFAPSGTGLQSAKLDLDSSGNYLPLAGVGTNSPHNSLSVESRYYPYYPISQSVSFENNSSSTIPISNIAIQSVTGAPEYAQTNSCGSSLAAGSSCTINVSSPRLIEGGTQALLTITAGTDPYTLLLDNSLFQVINFGDTSYSGASTGQRASYPLLDAFDNNSYSNLFEGSIAQSPWTSFSFTGCSVDSGTCVGAFNFNPTQPGVQTGNATDFNTGSSYFNSGPVPSVQQYILVGTGVATGPAAKLILQQSGFLNLPGAPVLNQGALTLINLGPHTLDVTGPALSGSSPQAFTLGQASCSQPSGANSNYPSIAEGTQCTIPIAFTSPQTGFSAATATVTDSTSGLTFSLPLYLDTLAGPTFSPSSLTFPGTGVYSVSTTQSLTVTRDITHPVTAGTSGGLIAIKGSCAAGETPCILTFTFAPTLIGESPAATVYDTTLGTSTNLPVSGTADGIVVYSSDHLSDAPINFPSQTVGTISASQTRPVNSGGPSALDLYSISLSGTNASEFAKTSNCPSSVPVNAVCTIGVSFVPVTAGFKTATLIINDSAHPGKPLTIPLSGTAQ